MPQLVYLRQKILLKINLVNHLQEFFEDTTWLTKWFVMWKMIAQIYWQWQMIWTNCYKWKIGDIGPFESVYFLLCPF
jgi:hypothetical protein